EVLVGVGPGEPGGGIVLAVGVVVATLAAAELVPAEEQRHPARQQQGGQQGPGLPGAELDPLGVGAWPLHPAVPGPVVAGPVPVALAVGLVVLAVVGHQVAQGEPVVDGDEVDGGGGAPARAAVQVRRATEAGGEPPPAPPLAAPEVPHGVAVAAVPLAPAGREATQVVAVGLADV